MAVKSSTGKAIAPADPQAAAEHAGLRYVNAAEPGINRQRRGERFVYRDTRGRQVRDADTLARIRDLAIPPAWERVWICAQSNGHIQAVGWDARGRKQYRYHRHWQEVRDEVKYHRMISFAQALPKIRRRSLSDLRRPGLPKEKVLAAAVQLLDKTRIRVGNEEYAKANQHFGLTTMRDHHAKVRGKVVQFRFAGKSDVKREIDLEDPRLAPVIQHCQDLPGQELFQYLDEDGEVCDITSADVNEYLKQISGRDFTAKDFRTWAGTVLAALALQEFESFDSNAQARRNIMRAIENVASRLGNTKAVCRKCYVHPAVLDSYLDGTLLENLKRQADRVMRKGLRGLPPEEAAVVALLESRLAREARRPRKAG